VNAKLFSLAFHGHGESEHRPSLFSACGPFLANISQLLRPLGLVVVNPLA
jgi:hypothetical protein